MLSSQLTHIFQRGRYTNHSNHQPDIFTQHFLSSKLFHQEDQHQPKKMLLNGTAKAVASGTQHSVVLMAPWTWRVWNTLWLCQQFAIENGPFIVDLPIKDGDFQ